MTEPTDAELDAVLCNQWPAFSMQATLVRVWVRAAMRDALAKFGTPPAVAGEPECTCSAKDMPFGTCCKVRSAFERWYDEQNDGRLQPFDVFKGGWIERHRLSSTPQPTQAQAGAVPLTVSQIRKWWESETGIEDCDMCRITDFVRVVRAVEERHGIKGGQHGADN